MVVQTAFDDFIGGFYDQFRDVAGNLAKMSVRQGARLLENSKSFDDRASPDEAIPTDREILDGSLGLGSPILVGFDVNFAHGVGFDAKTHGSMVPKSKGGFDLGFCAGIQKFPGIFANDVLE